MTDEEKNRLMVETWKTTGPLLEEIRMREARDVTETQRIRAMIDVLNLPGNRRTSARELPDHESGLIIQQAIFSKSWK